MKTSKVRISSDFECTQECWKTNQTVPTQGQMVLTQPMMESGCTRAIVVERKFTVYRVTLILKLPFIAELLRNANNIF